MQLIPVMQSWNFSIINPVFSITWSFINHFNMLIWLLSILKNICVEKKYVFQDFLIFFWLTESLKELYLKYKYF